MRCARLLLWALGFVAVAAGPADATSVTVLISGVWDDIAIDSLDVTDGAIVPGGSFTATLVFEDTTSDTDGTSNVGIYLLAAASTDLVLATGGFTFGLPSAASIELGIDDNVGGQDGFGFLTDVDNFTASGPFVVGASTGVGYANLSMFDSSQTAHSSDDLTALPWDASAYNNTNFFFLIETFLGVDEGSIELSGSVTGLTVLPEPSTLTLVAFVGVALAAARFRG